MTTEEALKIANTPMGVHLITVSHDALRTRQLFFRGAHRSSQ